MDEESKPTNNQPIPQVAPPDNQSDNDPNSSQNIQKSGSKTSSSTDQPPVSKDHPHVNLPDPETIKTLVSPQDKPTPKLMKRMILLLLLLVTVFAGLIAYLGYKNTQLEDLLERTSRKPAQELPTPTPDPTADWETYTSTALAFTLKYPPDYYIQETLQGVNLYNYDVDNAPGRGYDPSVDGNLFKIEISQTATQSGIDEWFADQKTEVDPLTGKAQEFLNVEKTSVDSYPGIFYELRDPMSDLVNANTTFQSPQKILIHFLGGLNYAANKITYNQILSTFKFTDSNDETVNWKTYLSQQFAYSFKYPPSWTVKETTNTTGLGNYIQTSILDEENNELIIINEDLSGMGCLEPPQSYPNTFQIGNLTVEQSDFCGTRNYFIETIADNKHELQLQIFFVGKPDENKGREILRSLKNVIIK